MPAASPARLRTLHRQLGISADYAQRRVLPRQREARRLVSIGPAADDGEPLRLAPGAARAWRKMRDAAARDGVELLPLSAFRSVSRQTKLVRRKLAAGQSIASILRFVAAPGHSEHHTGQALDLGTGSHLGLDANFARTRAYRWLRNYASGFGFRLSYPRKNRHGIGYEPWHWCWHS